MRGLLEDLGIEDIAEAADIASAKTLIAGFTKPPRVIVCDHRLPDGDGLDFLATLAASVRLLISGAALPQGSILPPGMEFREKPVDYDGCGDLARLVMQWAVAGKVVA